jgi:hypothetical protein
LSVRVTIEASSRAEAELIAQQLPVRARSASWRGFGVIRLAAKDRREAQDFIEAVSKSFHEHKLRWARVRYGDEERVFKANGRRWTNTGLPGPGQSTGSASGSANPAIR